MSGYASRAAFEAALADLPIAEGRRTIGGILGDGHGAGIEPLDTALLLCLVVTARWIPGP